MPRPRSLNATVAFMRGRVKPWRVEWRAFDDQLGKRRRYNEHFATEAEANTRQATINASVARETSTPPAPTTTGAVTFRAHAVEWLTTIVVRRKPGSAAVYERNLRNHVYPHLGDVLVTPATLTVREVSRVITKCATAGMSWGHQVNILRALSTCLRWAVKWQRLATNPATGLYVDLKDESWDEPEPHPFTREQMFAFLHWVRTNGREVPADYRPPPRPVQRKPRRHYAAAQIAHWYPYFLLLFYTGMRRNEGAALQWEDVYLDTPGRERIRVRGSYSADARRAAQNGDQRYLRSGLVKPKTKAGLRDLTDLAPELVDVLRELARTRHADALQQRRRASPFVILGPHGKRVTAASTVDQIFWRGMDALGLEGHTVHDLRDTFATLHLEADQGSLLRVSYVLGHSKPSTTMNRYAKWVDRERPSPGFAQALLRPDYGKEPVAAVPAGESARILPMPGGSKHESTSN